MLTRIKILNSINHTGAEDPDLVDPTSKQAPNYLGHFDLYNGALTHLNYGSIKHKGPNTNLNGLKLGFKNPNLMWALSKPN